MNPRDPFELFGLMDPFEDQPFTEEDEQRLLRIIETPVVGERPRRHSKRPWVAAIVVSGVVMATAAFAILHRAHAPNPTLIGCYRTASLQSDRAALPAAADPVAACAAPWTDGTFSTAGPPKLVGCVNPGGIAAVFPGAQEVCSKLGLAELEPGLTPELQAIVDLQDRLAAVFIADCYHQAAALAKAQQVLDESHLVGWTVHLAEDFPPGLECGGPGVLPDTKTVLVGGVRPENP